MQTAEPTESSVFRFNSNDLPVIYEDNTLLIYVDGAGDVFVETKKAAGYAIIRISPEYSGLAVTAHIGEFVLGSKGGFGINDHKPAVYIRSRQQ
ncbi:MAG TPA: hypothetical protein VJK04_00325 [Candidatus Paceibacterota bacterium]